MADCHHSESLAFAPSASLAVHLIRHKQGKPRFLHNIFGFQHVNILLRTENAVLDELLEHEMLEVAAVQHRLL